MSIIPKLGTSLNRRDEVPNQELAAEIVKNKDKAAVGELVENLSNKNKGIRHDCIKTVYEIGYAEPSLIAEYLSEFLLLLESRDNRMQWGAMTAIGCITDARPGEVFSALPKIIDAADRGSVITRDHCVKILVKLTANPKFAPDAFRHLLKQLLTCPTNQLPMYAENVLPVIGVANRERFIKVLETRSNDIEKESGRKRVEGVIKKLG